MTPSAESAESLLTFDVCQELTISHHPVQLPLLSHTSILIFWFWVQISSTFCPLPFVLSVLNTKISIFCLLISGSQALYASVIRVWLNLPKKTDKNSIHNRKDWSDKKNSNYIQTLPEAQRTQGIETVTWIFFFQLELIQIDFSQKSYSSYRLNTLGQLCLWQCFVSFSFCIFFLYLIFHSLNLTHAKNEWCGGAGFFGKKKLA